MPTNPCTEQPPKPARRWLRFSLRSMLLLVVVIAIPMGWKVNRARNQRVVVAELQTMHAEIVYDYQIVKVKGGWDYGNLPPPGPIWLTDLLGKEYFFDVYSVGVWGPYVTDETLALIAKLPEVADVSIGGQNRITDGGLAHFAGMHNLEVVALYSDRITGTGLVHLAKLKRLKSLCAMGWINDSSLGHISMLGRLELLNIYGATQITDEGLAHISKLHNLRKFIIVKSGSADSEYIQVSDEGLVHLYGLKNLDELTFSATQVTQAGIEKLHEALPNCRIEWNGSRIE